MIKHMGSILQTFLRSLSSDGEHPHFQHITTALGCCSDIRITEPELENAPPIKDEDDASDLGGLSHARVGN